MFRTILLGLAVALLLGTSVLAQVPPRYEIVTIDPDPTYNYYARMNNRGQIVYSVWFDDGNADAIDIFLYDDGEITRLTDDDTFDRTPDINDAGQIVWSRSVDGPGTPTQIVLWEDGELTQLTFGQQDSRAPRINNLGHVVWLQFMGDGCGGVRMDIFFYDGETIQRITTNGEIDELANQGAVINDSDEIAWTEYDFCDEPWWTSRIMLYSAGVSTQISPTEMVEPQVSSINNLGQVAWSFSSGGGEKSIQLWQDGTSTTLTDSGGGALLNNRGDLTFWRYYEGGPVGAYEVWLYRNGQFYQITDDPHDQGWNNIWNIPTDLNDRGEIPYISGWPWYYEMAVKCMKLRCYGGGLGGKVDPVRVIRP